MPSTDSTMQSISAPILVPGTQREPTMPSLPSDMNTNASALSGDSTSPTTATPRTSLSGSRMTTLSSNTNNSLATASGPNYNINGGSNNEHHHNYNHNHRHSHHPNNPNSGLRRFPSIGNTKKLTVENTTLKAKITELERYLTGLKEELILAHRQIHAYRLEIKTGEERKAVEIHELGQHIQKCEFELGAKVLECEGLETKLIALIRKLQQQGQEQGQGGGADADQPHEDVSEELGESEKVKALVEENKRKDELIAELLEKVDRLGTEVLSLEREKAHLERPLTPPPATEATTTAPTAVKHKVGHARDASTLSRASLKDLVPITAEAIIAATTPSGSLQNLSTISDSRSQSQVQGVSMSAVSGSNSNCSLDTSSTAPSTVQSDYGHSNFTSLHGSNTSPSSVNSVGYDYAVEHPKLLSKFQALRMQHAQASEYVDSLESENRELKIQLLDVGSVY